MRQIYLDLDGVVFETLPLHKYETERAFKEIPLIKGAIFFMESLKTLGKVNILSKTFYSRDHQYTEQQKIDKLNACLQLGFNKDDIHILSANEDKNILCKMGDILIDDYGNNIVSWERKGGVGIQAFEPKLKTFRTATNYFEILQQVTFVLDMLGRNVR